MVTSTPNTATNAAPSALQLAQMRLRLENQIKGGGSWFFWIAGMSVLNTVLSITGDTITFVVGLGFTQVVSGIATGIIDNIGNGSQATMLNLIAFLINLAVAVVFAVFGIFARKGRKWAFITGMVLYLLDTGIFIWAADWMSLIFHALALFGLYSGMAAIGKLKTFNQSMAGVFNSQPEVITQV